MNRTKAAATLQRAGHNQQQEQQQQLLLPHQHHLVPQYHHHHHHHLAAPGPPQRQQHHHHHSQPLLRRASANSILESHHVPPRPAQPRSTLSYPPSIPPPLAPPQQQLQPIAPMPAESAITPQHHPQLPYIQIHEPSIPGYKHHHHHQAVASGGIQPPRPPPSTLPSTDYFSYGAQDRGNIQNSLANLSLQNNQGGDMPARKRARSRSSIDMLASAAEYLNNEE
ncbi:hypothetical protein BDB00DRAFT_819499 [Zychaea mexicana]|uniref:uncharacterized protein n=1 Tax=Zychaea mexicana TaxID=64656 RepID=UPI0022FEC748|nr:uncharacterized protein BDB00DRAFT_819499 [Zychaea mexicana]KAI9494279.1 hypothetical protein BDB00DRAFT_819499 [Zychaea mexicana]